MFTACLFDYYAGVVRAANFGCSPEGAGLVHDYTVGIASVFPAAEEGMKHSLSTRQTQ
jgi:hypothetical protein